MKLAYLDTSVAVGMAFGEPAASRLARRLPRFDRVFSSNLLEAEFRSALLRERLEDPAEGVLDFVTWVYPNRPLTREIERVAGVRYLRGADLWHLANALFLAPDPGELTFLTLDQRQGEAAAILGFPT